jgi:hypothetical protein
MNEQQSFETWVIIYQSKRDIIPDDFNIAYPNDRAV